MLSSAIQNLQLDRGYYHIWRKSSSVTLQSWDRSARIVLDGDMGQAHSRVITTTKSLIRKFEIVCLGLAHEGSRNTTDQSFNHIGILLRILGVAGEDRRWKDFLLEHMLVIEIPTPRLERIFVMLSEQYLPLPTDGIQPAQSIPKSALLGCVTRRRNILVFGNLDITNDLGAPVLEMSSFVRQFLCPVLAFPLLGTSL